VPFCFLHTMLPEAAPDGIRVNTITLAFTLVAGTIVFLRLFTRFVLTKGAGFEDALIAIAMVSRPLSTFCYITFTDGGRSRRLVLLSSSQSK
jgi:hypothetical protein